MSESISKDAAAAHRLIPEINAHYREFKKNRAEGLKNAISIGELLLQMKQALPHGEFTEAVEKRVEFTPEWGRTCMRVAAGQELLAKIEHKPESITEAAKLIAEHRPDSKRKSNSISPPTGNDSISEKGSPGGGLSPSSTVPPASAAPEPGEAADSKGRSARDRRIPAGESASSFMGESDTVISGSSVQPGAVTTADPGEAPSGEDERTDSQGTKPQETDPRPPRSGKDKPGTGYVGKCPNCAGSKWTAEGNCAKCNQPFGEPVGDRAEDADPAGIKRAKAVKTCEALMREFDDLNLILPKAGTHKQSIELCKKLLSSAKGWK